MSILPINIGLCDQCARVNYVSTNLTKETCLSCLGRFCELCDKQWMEANDQSEWFLDFNCLCKPMVCCHLSCLDIINDKYYWCPTKLCHERRLFKKDVCIECRLLYQEKDKSSWFTCPNNHQIHLKCADIDTKGRYQCKTCKMYHEFPYGEKWFCRVCREVYQEVDNLKWLLCEGCDSGIHRRTKCMVFNEKDQVKCMHCNSYESFNETKEEERMACSVCHVIGEDFDYAWTRCPRCLAFFHKPCLLTKCLHCGLENFI